MAHEGLHEDSDKLSIEREIQWDQALLVPDYIKEFTEKR